MKLQRLIGMAVAAVMCSGTAYAQQPYGGCWHPDDIKNWSPQTDPDAKFNRARVPLASRFKEPTLMKANENQHYEGQICNATILFPTCSMCPSQGANNFLGYQPTYWQYMDKLVYWHFFIPALLQHIKDPLRYFICTAKFKKIQWIHFHYRQIPHRNRTYIF